MLIIKNPNNIEEYRVKAFPGVSDGKESTAVWETWVQFLDGDDPLENPHGQRSLGNCSQSMRSESDMTEHLSTCRVKGKNVTLLLAPPSLPSPPRLLLSQVTLLAVWGLYFQMYIFAFMSVCMCKHPFT